MKSNSMKALGVAVVLALAAFWYWSPLLTLHQMREAARAGDADAFSTHVDYPLLRENLKAQLGASLKPREESSEGNSDWGKATAAFGAMLGAAMIDRMVDAVVRPEVVMRAMQQGQLLPKREPKASSPDSSPGSSPDSSPHSTSPEVDTESKEPKPTWRTEHQGVNRFILYVLPAGKPRDREVGLVLERRGLVSWQLTDIRLPGH